ncbi:hypothetical protein NL676_008738 [Syzygium grande]|nr:hypothetical protein NL676_008738 [Syzygium grande]
MISEVTIAVEMFDKLEQCKSLPRVAQRERSLPFASPSSCYRQVSRSGRDIASLCFSFVVLPSGVAQREKYRFPLLLLLLRATIRTFVARYRKMFCLPLLKQFLPLIREPGVKAVQERSFVNIFAHSIDGMILLNALDIPIDDELTSGLLWEIVYFVTERIGANHVLQFISNSALGEGLFEILLNDNHPRVSETHCVACKIHLLLEDIYNDVEWVRKAFDRKQELCCSQAWCHLNINEPVCKNWDLEQSSSEKLCSNYYMLQSIMGVESELQSLVSSSEWLSLSFEEDELGVEVGEIIRSSSFGLKERSIGCSKIDISSTSSS